MPTRKSYHDNISAEVELFGYDPKIDGYPQPDNNVKFTGKEIGKFVVNEETLETIFKPNNSDKD
jgi:hypothetical protein